MAKTFEHASRADAQSVNPLYLCIVGGLALPENERGPLDTEVTPNSPFHAHDLLRPLDPRDVDDVFEQGVIAPIEVVRVNDIPTVNWGRGRVRKARLANIRRQSEGLPPIEVKFVVVRISNGLQLIKRAHAENLRRKTFGVLDQIELAKQLLLHGASEESAATQSRDSPISLQAGDGIRGLGVADREGGAAAGSPERERSVRACGDRGAYRAGREAGRASCRLPSRRCAPPDS